MSRFSEPSANALALVLLAAHFAMAVSASTRRSVCFDEPYHLTAGYLYLTQPEFPQAVGNGVFAQAWAALPLLALDPPLPDVARPPWRERSILAIGKQLLHGPEAPLELMLLLSRSMIALLSVGLGALVYVWSKRSFGALGGLLSLAVYAFCPNLLAHAASATTDLAAALGFLLATYGLWRALRAITLARVLTSLAGCALLLATKISSVLLLPIAAVLVLATLLSGRPLEVHLGRSRVLEGLGARSLAVLGLALVHGVVLCAAIWLAYDVPHAPGDVAQQRAAQLARPGLTRAHLQAALLDGAARAGVLPDAFVDGLSSQLTVTEMKPAFAAGEHALYGFRWFFPYTFAIKTPSGTLLLLLLAAAALVHVGLRARRARAVEREPTSPPWIELVPLVTLIGVYGAASIVSQINIGHRHLLPLYPPLYVLSGAAAYWLTRERKAAALLTLGALATLVVASVSIAPHYLAFFNRPSGGPERGYQKLVDSSLDWGQDLPGLAAWLRRERARATRPVWLSYFGTGVPERYGIHARMLPSFLARSAPTTRPLEAGTYCISATMLQSVYIWPQGPWTAAHEAEYQRVRGAFERGSDAGADLDAAAVRARLAPRLLELRFGRLLGYLRTRTPDAHVGYSILIFELSQAELARALDDPPSELRPSPPGLVVRPR